MIAMDWLEYVQIVSTTRYKHVLHDAGRATIYLFVRIKFFIMEVLHDWSITKLYRGISRDDNFRNKKEDEAYLLFGNVHLQKHFPQCLTSSIDYCV